MKKYLPYILILVVLAGIFDLARAADPLGDCTINGNVASNHTEQYCKGVGVWSPYYQLLAPLPCPDGTTNSGCISGKLENFNPSQPNNLGAYLNLMIKIFIAICAVLSVVMIVIGGVEVMTSELSHTKEAGKEKISQAILGLLIALGAYMLLYTINPDLLKSDLNPPSANVDIKTTPAPTTTPGNVQIDIETGRSIYSIHTTRSGQSPMCSVPPDGYDSGKTIGGVGYMCGTGQIAPEKNGFYQFCCKYDRLTQ